MPQISNSACSTVCAFAGSVALKAFAAAKLSASIPVVVPTKILSALFFFQISIAVFCAGVRLEEHIRSFRSYDGLHKIEYYIGYFNKTQVSHRATQPTVCQPMPMS